MTITTMVERMARAAYEARIFAQFGKAAGELFHARLGQRTATWDQLGEVQQQEVAAIRAAIATMRVPMEGMTVAGGEAIGPYLMASKDGRTGEVTPGLVQGGIHMTWQAMIDAAMAEADEK